MYKNKVIYIHLSYGMKLQIHRTHIFHRPPIQILYITNSNSIYAFL